MSDGKDQMQLDFLKALKTSTCINSFNYATDNKLSHDALVGCVKSLQAKEMVLAEAITRTTYILKPDAKAIIDLGKSPEIELLEYLCTKPNKSATMADIKKDCSPIVSKEGMKNAQASKYTKMDSGAVVAIVDSKTTTDNVFTVLASIAKYDEKTQLEAACKVDNMDTLINNLKKRKLLDIKSNVTLNVTKGTNFSTEVKSFVNDFTQEMILSGEADKVEFKPMNLHAAGTPIRKGTVHPLMQVQKKFKKVLLGMGFCEMPTDMWVESSFWNFDTLFQPQQHPARDAHDTFFLKNPSTADVNAFPADYFQTVADTHEKGGHGSIGWRYEYSKEETLKNILRTHTTACSSRVLYKMAQEYKETGIFTPKKYFSIDRVFRNETLDATHLAEFHQVEGFVADRNLSLCDLMAVFTEFYKQIGITNLKFKPAYNPYTEPSMEIFGYHEGKKQWMEVGNSGIFRPEMLRPMGLPEDVSVIAWGLSLERPTMIRHGIPHIRDLFGYKSVIGL